MVFAAHQSKASQRSRDPQILPATTSHRDRLAAFAKRLTGQRDAFELKKYQTELRRERAQEEREKALRKKKQRRFTITSVVRNRPSQAFWAMHVEALNWSEMELRAYAAAIQLSPHSLRKWRDQLAASEVTIDWRAIFTPPPVRPLALVLGTLSPNAA
ncbi:hypothetical protein [Bradyrhizobium sp. HKCCYLS3013]|uniref:hypothetical protein n=1 Tax=Bradyrhizobium sp. HKCCYLS3013 TaxID=3420735 RepID=UPI003EBED4FA